MTYSFLLLFFQQQQSNEVGWHKVLCLTDFIISLFTTHAHSCFYNNAQKYNNMYLNVILKHVLWFLLLMKHKAKFGVVHMRRFGLYILVWGYKIKQIYAEMHTTHISVLLLLKSFIPLQVKLQLRILCSVLAAFSKEGYWPTTSSMLR